MTGERFEGRSPTNVQRHGQLNVCSSIAFTLEDHGVIGMRLSESSSRLFEFHNDKR
jgi:hypothetical protein